MQRANDGPERFIRRPEVEHLTGLSRSTLYALIAARAFPRPVKLAARSVGWPESAIETWMAARKSASADEDEVNRPAKKGGAR